MKKGIFTFFGATLSPDETYSAIKNAGFETVMVDWSSDFIGNVSKCDNIPLAEKYGLEIENGHLSFKDINDIWLNNLSGDVLSDRLIKDIALAGNCGIKTLVIHTSTGKNPPPISNIGINRFDKIIMTAEKYGVTLAFENLRFKEYIDVIFNNFTSEKVGFCYDFGHRYLHTKEIDYLKEFQNKVVAVHIHDNFGISDDHLIPFSGKIDFKAEMQALSHTSYKGSLTLELKSATNENYLSYLETASVTADKLIKLMK
ncbi:MAG: sugar phosphate isomerase/epimerase [Clostridia bacterium]